MIRAAIDEVAKHAQAPLPLIAASALAAVSTAVQTRYSVQRDALLTGPTGLYLLTVAESGERKSTVDKLFTGPIREWEAEQRKLLKERRAKYEADKEDWERQGEELQRNIDSGFLTTQLGTEFDPRVIHRLNEPKAPRPVRILRGDDTPEALAAALADYPVAAIISAEAGTIFGSHGMKPDAVMANLSQANVMWDGGAIQRGRVGSGEMYVEGMRVTMGLQVQPAVLDRFVQNTGGLAKGIGYFARFLFCRPESTQGTRFYVDAPTERPALAAFCERMTTLLAVEAVFDEFDRLVPHLIGFDAQAQRTWETFHDEVEVQVGGEEQYSGIKDVASKAADNAARLACCFHVFAHGPSQPIGDPSMQAACSLMRWYLDEAVRFARVEEVAPEVADAQMLEEWLYREVKKRARMGSNVLFSVNEIRQKGPNPLRPRKKLDDALELLADHHRVVVQPRPGKKGADVILRAEVQREYRE
jgi:hypothetical protein